MTAPTAPTFDEALVQAIKVAIVNRFIEKVPFNDRGLKTIIVTVCNVLHEAAVKREIAPGVWEGNGFGLLQDMDVLKDGFYVFAPPICHQENAHAHISVAALSAETPQRQITMEITMPRGEGDVTIRLL